MQCLNCGKSLAGKKIYCDDVCRYAFYAKNGGNPPIHHRICKRCGKPFETNVYNQIYCCAGCAEPIKREGMFIKVCRICGKRFATNNRAQKYCSDSCRYANQLKVSREYNQRIKNFDDPQSVLDAPEKPPILCEESPFGKIAREANECGLSYGNYKAQLKFGKTYEELKADYEKRKEISF